MFVKYIRQTKEPSTMKVKVFEKIEYDKRKTNATRGRPKKSSVFSNRGSHFSKRFSNECETYEKVLPFAPSQVDQLQWWKNHEESLFAFLVRVICPIRVASSKSERAFSVAGDVVTQKRACLAPDCVIVKSNLVLLRNMGLRSK